MIVNERNWYAVRNTAGVTGFVGSDSTHPTPLTAEEVRQIMPSMGMEVEETVKPAKLIFSYIRESASRLRPSWILKAQSVKSTKKRVN